MSNWIRIPNINWNAIPQGIIIQPKGKENVRDIKAKEKQDKNVQIIVTNGTKYKT